MAIVQMKITKGLFTQLIDSIKTTNTDEILNNKKNQINLLKARSVGFFL